MKVVGIYSFKNGRQVMQENYASEVEEIYEVIGSVDAEQHKTKKSNEK
jgi:hypothetical protein